ncbi:MAG TPA: response regulator transcription factor [Vicinamibacterales bacterium]|nr:response regulator transcription factor [Vicinamibacterales bacterium]
MQAPGPRLLLVEDSEQLGRQILDALGDAGFEADWIRDGDAALSAAFARYSLVILDLTLPGASGFEILAHLRREALTLPVLILSGHTDAREKVHALDLGADDYLTKPFWPQELVARVKARLRRPDLRDGGALDVGALSIDFARRAVAVGEQPIDLTRAEFDLLAALARRRGAAVTREWLLEHVMGGETESSDRTLDVHVSRLRKKLGTAGAQIATVWGVGYRLGAER